MADTAKHFPGGGGGGREGGPPLSLVSEVRAVFRNRRAITLAYASVFAFVVFLVLSPSSSDPFLNNVFSPSSSEEDSSSYRSRVSFLFSYLFHPNNSTCRPDSSPAPNSTVSVPSNFTDGLGGSRKAFPAALSTNRTSDSSPHSWNVSLPGNSNSTQTAVAAELSSVSNQTKAGSFGVNWSNAETLARNVTGSGVVAGWVAPKTGFNHSSGYAKNIDTHPKKSAGNGADDAVDKQNQTMAKEQGDTNSVPGGSGKKATADDPLESLRNCDFFDGEWVRDESYPLYEPGSCSLIDEQFNCILNGRPDKDYQKLKWKPKGCDLPRLDGAKMLELLRGKRLAFVGDSLNRNMWESSVCILRGAVKDQSKVYEANGRMIFRGEASYSFIFKDYDLKIDFFVSPFLVREWEAHDKDGKMMETLRLDLISMSCDQYKGADIIVFNTGHWWTHDKTSKGKDYYQEGNHVYEELNVLEAFRKALTTWGRWVDANIDPTKTLVFFRGYSDSHFSGGQWNSGGQCGSETDPIKNNTYLREYPPKMEALEKVLKEMKTPVVFLNVTKMTDYRKDGHPSIYRKLHLTDAEIRSPLRYQDCSHWCLPGVPDSWNEIFYAYLLVKLRDKEHGQPQRQ